MSSSAITTQVAQLKAGNIQNQADSSSIYSSGQWSFKNSTAVASVTITDAGNVGIGTASPNNKLDVLSSSGASTFIGTSASAVGSLYGILKFGSTAGSNAFVDKGAQIRGYASSGVDTSYLSFHTSDGTLAERMRIDASGNLLVGKTAVSTTTAGGEVRPGGGLTLTSAQSTNSSTTLEVYSTGASAFRFYVGLGGTVFATSTTITGISDERLKENIRDLDDGLDVVLALKPRKFDWKEGKGADIKDARGFIAQEFEQVLPDMIEEWKDPAPEGQEPYKAVNANLIPTLVKAIQEQQAQIEEMKAKLAALEAKP